MITFWKPIHTILKTFATPQTVALVGESGSGKSTVISLLLRFYDPNSGEILLDGTEISKFQLRWLRQQMGLVSQEPALFNDTIRANIAYGKEGNATEAEIIAAAELSNAHKFICSLQKVSCQFPYLNFLLVCLQKFPFLLLDTICVLQSSLQSDMFLILIII